MRARLEEKLLSLKPGGITYLTREEWHYMQEHADTTTALLAERAKTHGDYSVHARVTQRLKYIIRPEPGYEALNTSQMEAIDMIFHKIGRIIAGNANFKDHWDDIAGYAKLVANQCPNP